MQPNDPGQFTPAHEALARGIARAAGRNYIDWPDLHEAKRQLTPNPANTPQPTAKDPILRNEPTAAPTPAVTRQSAPNHAAAPQIATGAKRTPPNRSPRPLSPNQLHAARLLVDGHSTNAIAATLHIDRHTLADWKRHPLFQRELRDLLDQRRPAATHF